MKRWISILRTWSGCITTMMVLLCAGISPAASQTQIVYHSFTSGVSRSFGNNATVTSLMGQSIFGVSKASGITVLTGYTAYAKGVLLHIKKMDAGVPSVFALYQNFPNPFNPSTTIRYGLPVRSRVTVTIFNILGQTIEQVINKEQSEGTYEILWNAEVASGIYFYRIEAVSMTEQSKTFAQLKKMVVLR